MPRKAMLIEDEFDIEIGILNREVYIYSIDEVINHPNVTQRTIDDCLDVEKSQEDYIGFAIFDIDINGNYSFIEMYSWELEQID